MHEADIGVLVRFRDGEAASGRFVTVVLPDADSSGDDPDGAEAKLEACQETAEGAE